MVQWIARLLQSHQHQPLIAMRGYKAKPGEKSDEQIEHEERLPEVPVIANPKRKEAIRAFLNEHGDTYNCGILDDGFQHRQVSRAVDIVLIDATRSPFEDRLLPAGFLREPVESLSRASAVILTGADLRDEGRIDHLRLQIAKHHGKPPIAMFRHAWTKLLVFHEGSEEPSQSTGQLAQRPLFAVCAIANPSRFFDQIELHGGLIAESLQLADHAGFSERVVARLIGRALKCGAEAIVTTQKDWVKIRNTSAAQNATIPFVRPMLEVMPMDNPEALESMILNAVSSFSPSS